MLRKITKEEIDREAKEGWFPVACRVCGSITGFHRDFYKASDFKNGYPCLRHEKIPAFSDNYKGER